MLRYAIPGMDRHFYNFALLAKILLCCDCILFGQYVEEDYTEVLNMSTQESIRWYHITEGRTLCLMYHQHLLKLLWVTDPMRLQNLFR